MATKEITELIKEVASLKTDLKYIATKTDISELKTDLMSMFKSDFRDHIKQFHRDKPVLSLRQRAAIVSALVLLASAVSAVLQKIIP